jgi:hypothetical protein
MIRKPPIDLAGAGALVCVQAAFAGPPMVTDDTGTATAGVLEIIAYAAHEERDSGKSTEGPALDLAYGVSDTVEVSLVIPRQRVQDRGQPSISGWGEAAVGVKWRFFDGANSALAIAPSLATPLSRSSTIRGLVADTTVFTLPVIGSIRLGRWEFTGNLGYSVSSSDLDALSVGASTGYDITPNLRVLGEFWGVDFVNDGARQGFINWRAGIQWNLRGDLALLCATGANIWSQLGSENELKHDVFVGIQYNIGK